MERLPERYNRLQPEAGEIISEGTAHTISITSTVVVLGLLGLFWWANNAELKEIRARRSKR